MLIVSSTLLGFKIDVKKAISKNEMNHGMGGGGPRGGPSYDRGQAAPWHQDGGYGNRGGYGGGRGGRGGGGGGYGGGRGGRGIYEFTFFSKL